MYALAASAAGVSALASAHPAEAKIVYTPAHVVLHARSQILYDLDLNHDGVKDFVFSHGYFYSSTSGFWGSIVQMMPYKSNGNVIMGHGNTPALKAGVKVGPGGHFSRYGIMAWGHGTGRSMNTQFSGAWANDGKGLSNRYLGLQFAIKGHLHYGWARVNVSKFRFATTLTGYAYETIPDKPIITGKTKAPDVITEQPDIAPGSLGRLALGTK
jgi:hypothetical protein